MPAPGCECRLPRRRLGSKVPAMRMWVAALVVLGGIASRADPPDTIHLKDQATITGKILAEKENQVAVDVGYTVLAVPRDQITQIVRATPQVESKAGKPEAAASPPANPAQDGPTSPRPEAAPSGTAVPAGDGPAPAKRTAASSREVGAIFTSAGGVGADRAVRDLVKELGEAVVQVRTPSGLGSGFFINEEGYLITNFHVIEGETQISVEVYHQRKGQLERRTYKQVRIVAMNKFEDLGLLKIEDPATPAFAWAPVGQSDALAVGERVFAIGSPLGLERTVTEGIVSTKTRQMQGGLYLQTTAQINPGNSGGPLFNLRGEVVGVTNMKMSFGEGLGFAIPTEQLRHFLTHRDAYAYDNDNPSSAYRYLDPPRRMKSPVAKRTE
jgi:serine protease Do